MVARSEEVGHAQTDADAAWVRQQVIRNTALASEIGPLYEDQLGRDDDNIGLRFQTDLPLLDHRRSGVAMAGFEALSAEEEVRVKRIEAAGAVARDYQELRAVASSLAKIQDDGFIEVQQATLERSREAGLMTGDQEIQIRQVILQRRRRQLELEHRFAVLRSRLHLHVFDAEG